MNGTSMRKGKPGIETMQIATRSTIHLSKKTESEKPGMQVSSFFARLGRKQEWYLLKRSFTLTRTGLLS